MTDVNREWRELRGSLPEHSEEIMVQHQGRPTIAVQDRTHGTGLPDEDHGQSEQEKYGN